MNKNILYGCSGLCCICLILLVLIYSLSWSGKTVKICEGKQLDIFSEEKLFQTIKVKSAHWESLIGDEGRKRIWIPTLQFRILQGTIVLPIEETQRIKLIYQWQDVEDDPFYMEVDYIRNLCKSFLLNEGYELTSLLFSKDFQIEMTKNSSFIHGYIFFDFDNNRIVFWLRTL